MLIASFIIAFKSLSETGVLTSTQIAHKVQQLFLHLIKRLPTIAGNSVFATVTVLWR